MKIVESIEMKWWIIEGFDLMHDIRCLAYGINRLEPKDGRIHMLDTQSYIKMYFNNKRRKIYMVKRWDSILRKVIILI